MAPGFRRDDGKREDGDLACCRHYRFRVLTLMPGPHVTIDLEKIEKNTSTVVSWCRAAGISIFGVTKGTCGMPQVARAMLRGGVAGLGESRLENIRRLRESGIEAPVMLLRSPPLSLMHDVIRLGDCSLTSELRS